MLGEVETGDSTEANGKRLQDDGKYIRHQDDKKKLKPCRRASSGIGGVVSGINVGHGNHEARANESRKFLKRFC